MITIAICDGTETEEVKQGPDIGFPGASGLIRTIRCQRCEPECQRIE